METLSTPTQEPKLEWNQPKLVELDVNNTEGGSNYYTAEGSTYQVPS